jgi:hypothetical protein
LHPRRRRRSRSHLRPVRRRRRIPALGPARHLAHHPRPAHNQRGLLDPRTGRPLLRSTLTFRKGALRWRGSEIPVEEVDLRTVTATDFARENTGPIQPASFAQLGIRTSAVTEVDLQHEDADITGASTEVPGDSVLLAAPNRIVVSACGVFFEATRSTPGREGLQPAAATTLRRRN